MRFVSAIAVLLMLILREELGQVVRYLPQKKAMLQLIVQHSFIYFWYLSDIGSNLLFCLISHPTLQSYDHLCPLFQPIHRHQVVDLWSRL